MIGGFYKLKYSARRYFIFSSSEECEKWMKWDTKYFKNKKMLLLSANNIFYYDDTKEPDPRYSNEFIYIYSVSHMVYGHVDTDIILDSEEFAQ